MEFLWSVFKNALYNKLLMAHILLTTLPLIMGINLNHLATCDWEFKQLCHLIGGDRQLAALTLNRVKSVLHRTLEGQLEHRLSSDVRCPHNLCFGPLWHYYCVYLQIGRLFLRTTSENCRTTGMFNCEL